MLSYQLQFLSGGGVKPLISIPSICLLAYFAAKIYKELSAENINLFTNENKKFWLIAFIILIFYCLLSGIGGFTAQPAELFARDPVYRDICRYEWPVIYDLSKQNEAVKAISGINSGSAALSYYIAYWFPPALISKIFSFDELGRNMTLWFWTFLGIFLTVYNLFRYFKKTSYAILLIFIFFSGLDIVGNLIHYAFLAITKTKEVPSFSLLFYDFIETWAAKYLYLSNITQFYRCLNQTVSGWLIVILFLQLRTNKNSLALSSLTFAYSSWAVFGIIPVALWQAFKINKKIRDAFTIQNILVPLMILVIFGSFYIMSSGAQGKSFYFTIKNTKDLCVYLLVVFLEIGVYILIMGKTAAKYDYYYLILIELILFPLYSFDDNLIMRVTIVTLFIFMIFILKFLFEEDPALKTRKILLSITLVIGAWTAITELNRNTFFTIVHYLREGNLLSAELMQKTEDAPFLMDLFYSLDGIVTQDNEDVIKSLVSLKKIYCAFNYENSFFFKYLAK